MDLAVGKVSARANVTLPASLRQIAGVNHGLGIGRRQNVVDPVATGAVCDHLCSQLRSQTVIAVFVTADTSTRNPEFLSQQHAFVTFRARVGRYRSRRNRRGLIEWQLDVVNPVTIRTYGRARNPPRHGLSVNALSELISFGPVALAAGSRNVDFGNS